MTDRPPVGKTRGLQAGNRPQRREMPNVQVIRAMLALLGAALILCPDSASGIDPGLFVPVEELSRGDRCTGKTVFHGTEVEEFELEILGVVRGVAPGSDMIIGRAEGAILEKTGILQGMSGSPVYRDGRLLGAVSSTWSYTKEPIAGITPIGEMLRALELVGEDEGERSSGGGLLRGAELLTEAELASSTAFRIADLLGLTESSSGRSVDRVAPPAGSSLQPLAAPLVVTGADDGFLAGAAAALGAGLVPTSGGGAASGAGSDAVSADRMAVSTDRTPENLVPGSAVGVQFVRGDVDWTAVGTVTHLDGDRLVAFGHPLFNSGPVEMPMVSAYVHALLPLQSVSFKYASGGRLLGTVSEDRNRTVAGTIGPGPRMVPVSLTVGGEFVPERLYRFEVISSRPHAPLFTGLAAGGAISSAVRSSGPATVSMTARIDTGHETIEYSDVLRTTEPATRTAGELSLLLSAITQNGFVERELESVELDIRVDDDDGWILIERVEAGRPVYAPGERAVLTVTLRAVRGEQFERELTLELPKSIPDGELLVRVGGAQSFYQWERDRLGMGMRPRTYRQLLELIGRAVPANSVVAQALSDAAGFSLSGAEIRSAPGRAELAMASSAASGAFDPAALALLSEDEIAVTGHVSGFHEFRLLIRSDR